MQQMVVQICNSASLPVCVCVCVSRTGSTRTSNVRRSFCVANNEMYKTQTPPTVAPTIIRVFAVPQKVAQNEQSDVVNFIRIFRNFGFGALRFLQPTLWRQHTLHRLLHTKFEIRGVATTCAC